MTQPHGTDELSVDASALLADAVEVLAAPKARQLWLWAGIPVGIVVLVITDGLLSPWPDFVAVMTAAAMILGWLRRDIDACWFGPTLSIAPGIAIGMAGQAGAAGLLFVSNTLVLAALASVWTLSAAVTGWLSGRRHAGRGHAPLGW